MNAGLYNVELVTRSQAESQGAGPCIIRGISIRRPAEPRFRTYSGGRQNLIIRFRGILAASRRRALRSVRRWVVRWRMPGAAAVLCPRLGI